MGNTTGAAHAITRSRDGIAVVPSLAVVGGRALPVEVEVQISGGVPGLDLSCLGPCSGDVARRVAHALRSGGYELPRRKVSVNIQPRSLARQAAGLDLAILVDIRRMGDVFTIPASFLTVATASAPDPSWTPGMYRHYIDSVTDLAWELGIPMVVNVVPGPRADTTYSTAELSSMVERGIDDGPRSVARTIADMDWSEGIEPEHEREAALYERSLAHPHGSPRGDDGALGSSLEAARAAAEALDQAFRDPRAARSDAIGRE